MDNARIIWECINSLDLTFNEFVEGLNFTEEELIDIHTKLEIFSMTVTYPYFVFIENYSIILNEDGTKQFIKI